MVSLGVSLGGKKGEYKERVVGRRNSGGEGEWKMSMRDREKKTSMIV